MSDRKNMTSLGTYVHEIVETAVTMDVAELEVEFDEVNHGRRYTIKVRRRTTTDAI